MAIIEMQGLDDIADGTDFINKVTELSVTSTPTILAGQGRNGGNALQIANNTYLKTVLAITTDFASIAFHINIDAYDTTDILVVFSGNSGLSASTYHGGVRLGDDGSLIVFRENNIDEQIVFPAGSIVPGEYYYFCASIYRNGTGTLEVRLNNATVTVNADFYDASYGSTCYAAIRGKTDRKFDDIVFTDDNTHVNYSPSLIYHIPVASDLAQADFTPVNAGAGYAELDELIADGDATYIHATDIGDASEFGFGTLPAEVTEVRAVKLVTTASREGSGGTNGVLSTLKTGSDTDVASTNQPLTDGVYTQESSTIVTVNPDTAAAFTVSELEASYVRCEVV